MLRAEERKTTSNIWQLPLCSLKGSKRESNQAMTITMLQHNLNYCEAAHGLLTQKVRE